MTKAELVSNISVKTGIEKLTTLAVVESMMDEIKKSITENFRLTGLPYIKQYRFSIKLSKKTAFCF